MENMWSDKKWINILINVLLFLVSVNFLHYGQLILPIICLVLFIDNKFIFKVNDIKTFIVLCLFAISFFCFGYKLGFYRTMGFCLPMAYYIGSNFKNKTEESIKKLIYLVAFGMIFHTILNFGYDLYLFGLKTFTKNTHYDIWLRQGIAATTTASNCVILTACIYYLLVFEKNKYYKLTLLIAYVVFLIYNIGLGRRMPVFMLCVSLIVSLFAHLSETKDNKEFINKIIEYLVALIVVILIAIVAYTFNIFNMKTIIQSLKIYKKFKEYGFELGRLDIIIDAIKLMPYHMWGNQEISGVMGIAIHDLLIDTYDLVGMVPFLLMLSYAIIVLKRIVLTIRSNRFKNSYNVLYISLFICITIEMLLEPIMSSLTLFLFLSVILFEAIII